MEWQELDLTLRQFNFPTSEQWDGNDKYGYVLEHLQRGEDDSRVALYEYLYENSPSLDLSPIISEGPWEPNQFWLFLSHVNTVKQFVSEVKQSLRTFAIDGFIAHQDIEPTKKWVNEIELALNTCHALAAFLTPDFHKSDWTDQEIGYGISRKILIVPVQMGINPYGFIGRYQALPGENQTAGQIARNIFEILVRHNLTAAQMANALVSQFEDSGTFQEAISNVKLLEDVKVWTPELLRSLENSIQRNSQISGAWGVPEKVRVLITRHTG